MQRQGTVALGEEAVDAGVPSSVCERSPPLHQGELRKSKVPVDLRQVCRASGQILVQQCGSAVDRATSVKSDRRFDISKRLDRTVCQLLAHCIVEPWRRIIRIERLGRRKL